VSVWAARKPGVADILTLGNALCGMVAMLVVTGVGLFQPLNLTDQYRVAALLLLAGTFLDVVDGAAARRWGGTPLGPPLDCLADAITFGVGPVVAVVAVTVPTASSAEQAVVMAGAMAFAAAALIRLADFAAHHRDDRDFVGLPTTSACMGAIALGFLPLSPSGVAVGLTALGVLMVSPMPYPAGTRVVGVLLGGWIVGASGIIGLVEVRVCAVLTLLLIVVVPVTTAIRDSTSLSRST
jgi:phosphatidylserine synthase